MSSTVKICLDKPVPLELEELATKLSISENPANRSKSTTPFELAAHTRFLWKTGSTLNVRFLEGHSEVCAKVKFYSRQWERYANIKFNFVETGPAHIRIAFIRGNGSWSQLGTQALIFQDQHIPTMNYGWLDQNTDDDEYARVVLHEFGHALGCIHEHQHPENGIPWDKERAYIYYGKQGWTREEVDNQVFEKYSKSILRYSEFDPESIMMYPIPKNITSDNFSVGWNRQLSEIDKKYIGELYPF